MMPLHYMRLGGPEFLQASSTWTLHLVRRFVAQEKKAQGGQDIALSRWCGWVSRASAKHVFKLLGMFFAGEGQHPQKKTTPVGFEPTRGDPIGLAGRRLNCSAKVSM